MQPLNSSPKCPESPIRILIVDDEADALDLYRISLGRLQPVPEVLSARTGSEALEIWAREKSGGRCLDLVISDVYFGDPKLTGLTLLEALRTAGYEGKLAILTGDEDAKRWPREMFGIDRIWMKPMDAVNLGPLVCELMNMNSAEKPRTAPTVFKTKSPVVDYVTLGLLTVLVMLSLFNLVRSLYTAPMIQDINAYITKNPQTFAAKGGQVLEARIPAGVGFVGSPLRDGSQDVTFRVSPEDASKVRQLAQKRGVRLRVEVR